MTIFPHWSVLQDLATKRIICLGKQRHFPHWCEFSISLTAYLHPFSLSKHLSNAFTRNHPLTLTSVCLVVSLMLPMSMFPISSIIVPLLVSSLVIPFDKKLINCSIYPPEKYSPAGMYIFMKITFLSLPPSLSSLPLI